MPDAQRPALVPSSLFNLQLVLDDLLGGSHGFLLAATWSFSRPDPTTALAEFDLPIAWPDFAARIARFGGIDLIASATDSSDAAYGCLDLGQPVVIAVDSFALPYRPAFGRVHSARTIVANRIDRAAGTVDVIDTWMPAYTGSVRIDDLDRARRSLVIEDRVREPLYAGVALDRRWWTLALAGPGSTGRAEGAMAAIEALAIEAGARGDTASTTAGLAEFRQAVMVALCGDLHRTAAARRSAALQLRAEIGLRAYLLALFRHAARLIDDSLFSAEVERWSQHLHELGIARDVLIKSVGFDRPDYAAIVDRALAVALTRERHFLGFIGEFCAIAPAGTAKGNASC